MDEALAPQAAIQAEAGHEGDRALFEDAGADAAFDIGAVTPLEDHDVDAVLAQHVAQQHAGRPRADDGDPAPRPASTWIAHPASLPCPASCGFILGKVSASRKRL